jgi:glycosyltransferase involved in cell wall biosynthesis
LVSVVITTRDRSGLVQSAVESVLALDQSTFRLEIIVVDDGSVDDTPDVLARLPVRVVRTTGLGIPGARNTGLHQTTGEFVNFLDDDDLMLPGAISAQLDAFADHPEFGAVFGRAQRTSPDLEPFGDPFPAVDASSGWLLEELLGYQPQIGTMLTRREIATQIGGFNMRYAGDDEWDFYLRIARQWQIGRIPQTVMLFRQRTGAEEVQQWRRTRYVREVYRLNTDHLPVRRRLVLRPVFWRVKGWNCYQFSSYAVTNWRDREYGRALRSVWYALRWSPLHLPVNLWRISREAGSD